MESKERLSKGRSRKDRSNKYRSIQQVKSGQAIQDWSSQHCLSQDGSNLRAKMHLRLEFDSGVGPTCLFSYPSSKVYLKSTLILSPMDGGVGIQPPKQ